MGNKYATRPMSSVSRAGYNAYVNPILRAKGIEAVWKMYERNLNYGSLAVEIVWKNGWLIAKRKNATKRKEPTKIKYKPSLKISKLIRELESLLK